ncbi:MAG: Ig-like domain-containing protein [Lachnospiraceae bacterium]|nr:Ig-like domain-containing protein [Lachnospiraceae bacterium]
MKWKKRVAGILAVILILTGFVVIRPEAAEAAVKISKQELQLEVGQSKRLKIKGAGQKAVWSSENRDIARVKMNGKVKGISEGLTTITAKVGKKKLTCQVVVYKSSVILDKNSASVWVDEEKKLEATVTPKGRILSWSSEDPKIATVKNGKVKGVSPGTTYVTAWSQRSYGRCKVTVLKEGIYLDQTELELYLGRTARLTASTLPADLKVLWSTSDARVATVYEGAVTAVSEGTAVITATAGGYSAECVVTVTSGSITLGETFFSAYVGETHTLMYQTVPENVMLSWSSNKPDIAEVQNGVVTVKNPGDAIITASFGEVSETCTVSVMRGAIEVTPETVSLDVDDTATLSCKSTPDYLPVSWSSDDTKVATVQNGKVKALRPGTAIITAECAGAKDTCTVTVGGYYIGLRDTALELLVDATQRLEVETIPQDVTIVWESTKPEVAVVDERGYVTAKKKGETDITASFVTADGLVQTSKPCHVTVVDPSVILDETELKLVVGDKQKLGMKTNPLGRENEVSWSSTDEAVAEVDSRTGEITAKGKGNAIIQASLGSGRPAECYVNVREPRVILEVEPPLSIVVGETFDLKPYASTDPAGRENDIKWKSDDTKVAVVKDGVITPVEAGTTTIEAWLDSWEPTKCKVVVRAPSVKIEPSSIQLPVGESETLKAITDPEGDSVKWSTSDPSVVTVDNNGKIVAQDIKAAETKDAVITATCAKTGKSATCIVTVYKATITPLLDKLTIEVGDSSFLSAEVTPETVPLTWSSNNPAVAEVDQNGVVTGKGAGTAYITVTGGGAETPQQCKVTVNQACVATSVILEAITDPEPFVKIEGMRDETGGIVYVVHKSITGDYENHYCSYLVVQATGDIEAKTNSRDPKDLFMAGQAYKAVFVPTNTKDYYSYTSKEMPAAESKDTSVEGTAEFDKNSSTAKNGAELTAGSTVVIKGLTLKDQYGRGMPWKTESGENIQVKEEPTNHNTSASWKADKEGNITITFTLGNDPSEGETLEVEILNKIIKANAPSQPSFNDWWATSYEK